MNRLLSLLLLLFSPLAVWAQDTGTLVRGEVYASDGKAIEHGEVTFLQADTVAAAAMTDSKGKFEIKDLPAGDYICRVAAYGYRDEVESLAVKGSRLNIPRIVLRKDSVAVLDELTVTADQSLRTKDMAGMTVYQLSSRAKQENDAYLALQEIPRLRVNSVDKLIKLDNGSTPLVLIDGVNRPEYLKVLRPDMIESVEVIDNPPARYRANSTVSSVLNIKLKSKAGIQPYINGNASLGLMPPFRRSQEAINAEIGTATSSLSLSGSHQLDNKIKNEVYDKSTSPTLERSVLDNYKDTHHNLYLTLNADKILDRKNYVLLNLYYLCSPSKRNGTLSGELYNPVTDESTPLTGSKYSKNRYHVLQADLYYKHSFSDSHLLEITGNYNLHNTGGKSFRKEINDWNPYESQTENDDKSNIENLKIDYSIFIAKAGTFQAGSASGYTSTRTDDIFDNLPVYKYRQFHEYLYAGFDNYGLQKSFSYNVSLGLDVIARNAGGSRYTYVDFIPSVALGYAIGHRHYLNLNYDRSRITPSMWQLNPYNDSTDEYNIWVGNPYLNPGHSDKVNIGYTLTYKKWRINPYLTYLHTSDIITTSGSLDGDVYTNTYVNQDYEDRFSAGTMINYRMPCGYIGGSFNYTKLKIPGMPYSGNLYSASINSNLYYKKFSAYILLSYFPYYYSAISRSEMPFINSFTFYWRFNRALWASIQFENLLFYRAKYQSWVENGDYSSYSSNIRKGLRPSVMFTISYSFANKIQRPNRQKKYIQLNNPEFRDK